MICYRQTYSTIKANVATRLIRSELLLFMEKGGEADDGSVYQQTANNGHDHGLELYQPTVCQQRG